MIRKNLSVAIACAVYVMGSPVLAENQIQIGEFGHDGEITIYREMFRATLPNQATVEALSVIAHSDVQHLRRKSLGIDHSCRTEFMPLSDPHGSAIRVGSPQPEGTPVLLDRTAWVVTLKCQDNGCSNYAEDLDPWELRSPEHEDERDPEPLPGGFNPIELVTGVCQTPDFTPVASPCRCHVTVGGDAPVVVEELPQLCASVPMTTVEFRLDQWLKPYYLP